ncbi:hypothetical protein EVAR_3055_1 [Eumeta japonica]|uniref:Uncharacterized protein n=1 Tax=Eumeta variegata TaxID=151549 RepID=A0A4C1SX15_EUMVA|nr:hypothetical protein EVAR_3055_1 [Eumeta japonica]
MPRYLSGATGGARKRRETPPHQNACLYNRPLVTSGNYQCQNVDCVLITYLSSGHCGISRVIGIFGSVARRPPPAAARSVRRRQALATRLCPTS